MGSSSRSPERSSRRRSPERKASRYRHRSRSVSRERERRYRRSSRSPARRESSRERHTGNIEGRRRSRSPGDDRRREWEPSRRARPPPGPCFNCGQEGHLARDCPEPRRDRRMRREDDDDDNRGKRWGRDEHNTEEMPDKEVKPDFGLSGALAAESNTVNGVVLLYQEPPEAAKPVQHWRLYVFKNGEPHGEPLFLHRQSSYLFGRDQKVVDIPTIHPSCSKQHCVLQYRRTEKGGSDGMMVAAVRPYIMDLGSTNGTFLNGERLESQRYYELLEQDMIRVGNSSREYVLLHDKSRGT